MTVPVRIQNQPAGPDDRPEVEADPILRARLERSEVNVPARRTHRAARDRDRGCGSAEIEVRASPSARSWHPLPDALRIRGATSPWSANGGASLSGARRRVGGDRTGPPAGSLRRGRRRGLRQSGGRDHDVIEGLIDYPYGCGEQTGSRLDDLRRRTSSEGALGRDPATLDGMIATGILGCSLSSGPAEASTAGRAVTPRHGCRCAQPGATRPRSNAASGCPSR